MGKVELTVGLGHADEEQRDVCDAHFDEILQDGTGLEILQSFECTTQQTEEERNSVRQGGTGAFHVFKPRTRQKLGHIPNASIQSRHGIVINIIYILPTLSPLSP